LRRIVNFNWPSTFTACAASGQTTLSAPQRSPYRLMLFENELATK
jgi:hypothetical protein